MNGNGFWILDTGYWILDEKIVIGVGIGIAIGIRFRFYRIQDARYKMQKKRKGVTECGRENGKR